MYGMGGYGGLGGMSSYGGGYGGYGSSYGGSYGGYGSRLASTAGQAGATTEGDGKQPVDPNNPDKRPPPNARKTFFQEWFKMMGGLRSILELGFAMIALAQFYNTTSDLSKKFLAFAKESLTSLARFVESKLPREMMKSVTSPKRRAKTLKAVLVTFLRVITSIMLCVGIKLRMDIKKEARQQHEQTKLELEKLRGQEVEMQLERPDEVMRAENEAPPVEEANL